MHFLVATLTPFDRDGKPDLGRLRAHILWLQALGVDGFVPNTVVGEMSYLTDKEREAIQRTVLDACGGKAVFPCTWDPSPVTTRYLTDAARDQGAAGICLPPPLLYRLDDDAIDAWYRSVQPRGGFRMLAIQDPDCTPATLSHERFLALRAQGVLAGGLDASADLHRLRRLSLSDPGSIFATDDRVLGGARALPQLAGVVSTLANVWPQLCLRLHRGEGQLDAAVSERANAVRVGGGWRALKAIGNFGFRAPLIVPKRDLWSGLPPAESPR